MTNLSEVARVKMMCKSAYSLECHIVQRPVPHLPRNLGCHTISRLELIAWSMVFSRKKSARPVSKSSSRKLVQVCARIALRQPGSCHLSYSMWLQQFAATYQ